MLTLRFCSSYPTSTGHQWHQSIIECNHYTVDAFENRISIVTYGSHTTASEGTERTLSDESCAPPGVQYYESCFVMNSEGRTIDKIRFTPPGKRTASEAK